MPDYRTHGKIETPLTDEEWLKLMAEGHFAKDTHRGFVALLYYTAVRRNEALRTRREQLVVRGDGLSYSVGKRLKHGIETPALPIPLEAPYVDEIIYCRDKARPSGLVWTFCEKTAYNIVNRIIPAYPHYFRLSRITNFFLDGWTIAQVRSWTGLTLKALNYYVGLVDIAKMGESLK